VPEGTEDRWVPRSCLRVDVRSSAAGFGVPVRASVVTDGADARQTPAADATSVRLDV